VRYFFKISYNGTSYHGWQKQRNAISVQEVLESHLGTILQTKTEITGSGRTDTGVHARQQFFHVDISGPIQIEQFRNKMNAFLPNDICIHEILPVKEGAHSRFDARERRYEYWITKEKNAFLFDFSYRFNKRISIKEMNDAARILIDKKDFESFSRVKTDVNNFNCEISRAQWVQDGEVLKFHISANRFLRGMVRAIVGTLLDVGQGKRSIEDFNMIIESKDRKSAGRAVPAKGLYLTEVKYPQSIFIK
jgi:tRNA pseudouridine38-40 synthase